MFALCIVLASGSLVAKVKDDKHLIHPPHFLGPGIIKRGFERGGLGFGAGGGLGGGVGGILYCNRYFLIG